MAEQKYIEVVEAAQMMLSRDTNKNKAAFLFLAQAQVELGGT